MNDLNIQIYALYKPSNVITIEKLNAQMIYPTYNNSM